MKWAEIEEFPGYEVSDGGDIRRVRKVSWRKPDADGKVRITERGKVRKRSVRKLVRRYHE